MLLWDLSDSFAHTTLEQCCKYSLLQVSLSQCHVKLLYSASSGEMSCDTVFIPQKGFDRVRQYIVGSVSWHSWSQSYVGRCISVCTQPVTGGALVNICIPNPAHPRQLCQSKEFAAPPSLFHKPTLSHAPLHVHMSAKATQQGVRDDHQDSPVQSLPGLFGNSLRMAFLL